MNSVDSFGGRKLAFVLWNGGIGGSEVVNVALAEHFRRLGAQVTVVFVEQSMPLASRLSRAAIPHRSLGFGRGRHVLWHPRRYAAEITRAGPDGALLVECGFIGAALRLGGYQGPIVAAEHGPFNETPGVLRRIARAGGAWAHDAEIAVSDFILERMRQHIHARRLERIYNGIDPGPRPQSAPPVDRHDHGGVTVGFMGRLIEGKGADHLIRAVSRSSKRAPITLLIAGDGPERPRLESLGHALGIGSEIEFLGVVNDVRAFWRRCDITAVPAAELSEGFSMVTLEAMASGRPIVATRNGAIPELVIDGATGTLVPPGDVDALAEALTTYAKSSDLRNAHGRAAWTRASANFHIEDCARRYLDLFVELAKERLDQPERPRANGTQ